MKNTRLSKEIINGITFNERRGDMVQVLIDEKNTYLSDDFFSDLVKKYFIKTCIFRINSMMSFDLLS